MDHRLKQDCWFTIIIVLLLLILSCASKTVQISHYASVPDSLIKANPDLENIEFWLSRCPGCSQSLMSPAMVDSFNQQMLANRKLYLTDLQDFITNFDCFRLRGEIEQNIKVFAKPDKYYAHYGLPLQARELNKIIANTNLDGIVGECTPQYAVITSPARLRALPTDEVFLESVQPDELEFDQLQFSTLEINEPVYILHQSTDEQWYFVQSASVAGWAKASDVAITDSLEFFRILTAKNFLIVSGSIAKGYPIDVLQGPPTLFRMGTRLQILEQIPQNYLVEYPYREFDGSLAFGKAIINEAEPVSLGYSVYTSSNLLRTAFSALNNPYGWGGDYDASDCSSYIQEVFKVFGIQLPRNSSNQGICGGRNSSFAKGENAERKLQVLRQAKPGATLLRIPGHIMIFVGFYNNQPYVIHNIWAFRNQHENAETIYRIGKVAVTSLMLGEHGSKGSLLDRLTNITEIGF
jgi:hypothetical protein